MSESASRHQPVDLPVPCCEHCQKPISFQPLVEQAIATAKLSRRSADVLRLMLKGMSGKEIADLIGITETAVKSQASQIFDRYGVSGRIELTHLLFPS